MTKIKKQFEVLGTVVEIILEECKCDENELFEKCFNELKRIEKKYSRFNSNSYLNKLNSKLFNWQSIDEETYFLIDKSLEFGDNTNGNFDITLKNSLEKLGYDEKYTFKDKKNNHLKFNSGKIGRILGKLKKLRFGRNPKFDINFNEDKTKIYLKKEIEFGGIGKGYALDCVKRILENNSIAKYLINAGGDIISKVSAVADSGWRVYLEHPDDNEKVIGEIELKNDAFASSSPKYRKWEGGHHLINSKTKLPQNTVKSIFILGNGGIEVDAYATALFTAGFDDAIKISKKLNLKILIISNNDKMYKSQGLNIKLYSN